MSTHRALVLHSFSQPLSLETRPTPPATPGTHIVSILATRIVPYTRAIITASRGRTYPLPLPCVPGVGAIARVLHAAPDSTTVEEGDLVFADAFTRARDAPGEAFLIGWHAGGAKTRGLAGDVWRDGSFAQVMKAPVENVLRLDEGALLGKPTEGLGLGLGYSVAELAAGLTDLLVPYGGLLEAGVTAGSAVVIAPATGTFGGAAVRVALAMGARVVVCVGRSADKLASLVELHGARRIRTVRVTGDVAADADAISTAAGDQGPDVYQDWSPPAAGADGASPTHIEASIRALRPGGAVSLMGGIVGNIGIPYEVVMHRHLRVLGRFMYERGQAEQVVKMVESGMLELGERVGLGVRRECGLEGWESALVAAEENEGAVVLRPNEV